MSIFEALYKRKLDRLHYGTVRSVVNEDLIGNRLSVDV